MYQDQESIFYYITMYNENYAMPSMPEGSREGILKGLYRFRAAEGAVGRPRVQLLGSGPILREVLRAQQILSEQFGVAADVWSATSFNQLRRDALTADRWNRLHPEQPPQVPYVNTLLDSTEGPIIAATDYMKIVADQVAPWLAGRLYSLGTDGFGRSDNRAELRRFFEVNAEAIALAALYQLSKSGKIPTRTVTDAIAKLGINPETANPMIS
jgi:pyruvate dehydrogenase E1 component